MKEISLFWEGTKEWLSDTLHLSQEALHVLGGLLLFLLFGRMMRRPLRSALPLIPVAVLELLNEWLDYTRYSLSGWPWRFDSTHEDIALTLLPPLGVLLTAAVIYSAQRWCRLS